MKQREYSRRVLVGKIPRTRKFVDDEDFIVTIAGKNADGKSETRTLYCSKTDYDLLKAGDDFSVSRYTSCVGYDFDSRK